MSTVIHSLTISLTLSLTLLSFSVLLQVTPLLNMEAHSSNTGVEILAQTNHCVTHFVMAASTGGTIMGVGKCLKRANPAIEVVLADPEKSNLAGILESREDIAASIAILQSVKEMIKVSGGVRVEGAGKESLTGIMSHGGTLEYVDYAVRVNDFDAFDQCQATAASGFLVGGSSGVNICAAKAVAEKLATERKGGVIVTILCDHGIKYMSKVFNADWIAKHDDRSCHGSDASSSDGETDSDNTIENSTGKTALPN